MTNFIHLPYGTQNPYDSEYKYERDPYIPIAGEKVILNYVTDRGILGQRSWVELVVGDEQTRIIRSECRRNVPEGPLWYAKFQAPKTGTKVTYRFGFGRGLKTAEYSDWYEFTAKEWTSIEDKFKVTDEILSFKPEHSTKTKKERIKTIKALTDGKNYFDMTFTIQRKPGENFYGLGEHYDSLTLQNEDYFAFVYDQWKVQKKKGYAPVPFIFSDKGFGLFFDTGYVTKYTLTEDELIVSVFSGDLPIQHLDLHYWEKDNPIELIKEMYKVSKPTLPPKWAFGPWLSANQWNSQKKMEAVLQKVTDLNLPSTVAVIEAWSDEQSFYIFNGAEYKPVGGEETLSLKDFNFNDPWPDPKKMVDAYEKKGIKMVLWQIPVLNSPEKISKQHENDKKYVTDEKLIAFNKDGSPYQIPKGKWFEHSNVVDFFKDEAKRWWQSKRKYLFDEIGIAGLKTDGGEHLWGRDTLVNDNESAAKTRNLYPEVYFRAAKELVGDDCLLFSRAGYTRSPKSTIFWVGDEDSNFEAMHDNFIAGLNVSISGNPFWGWDIAGFSGELPSKQLYLTALWNSIFVPIFQLHSEDPQDPVPSAERTPWNMAEVYDDPEIINIYRRVVSLRMSLLPYIYKEASYAAQNSVPLTTPILGMDKCSNLCYYFGRDMIVFPRLSEEKIDITIELPEGGWINLWTGEKVDGKEKLSFTMDKSPQVFVRENAAVEVNVDENTDLFSPKWGLEENGVIFFAPKEKEYQFQNYRNGKVKFLGYIANSFSDGIIDINWEKI